MCVYLIVQGVPKVRMWRQLTTMWSYSNESCKVHQKCLKSYWMFFFLCIATRKLKVMENVHLCLCVQTSHFCNCHRCSIENPHGKPAVALTGCCIFSHLKQIIICLHKNDDRQCNIHFSRWLMWYLIDNRQLSGAWYQQIHRTHPLFLRAESKVWFFTTLKSNFINMLIFSIIQTLLWDVSNLL